LLHGLLHGLLQTSAGHGVFLIQLAMLLVPAAQDVMGVAIPTRLWSVIALALLDVFLFTQDTGASNGVGGASAAVSAASMYGDALCVVAAIFYATYDLRLFQWG
jgi:drug/metabolite transporter (DMT)-like permease